MNRWVWGLTVIFLVGCGGTVNAPATQTRTSEIIDLTVAARILPTQNPATPPTPVPVTITPADTPRPGGPTPNGVVTLTAVVRATQGSVAPTATLAPPPTPGNPYDYRASDTVAPTATLTPPPTRSISVPAAIPTFAVPTIPDLRATIAAFPTIGIRPPTSPPTPPIPGSWVAYSAALRIRLFAPPSLTEDPEHTGGSHYALGSPSNIYNFEALTIYRFAGARGGDFASTFTAEADALSKAPNIGSWTITSGPRQQQVSAYQGNVGQFHYNQMDNGLPISGTMWVGAIGSDEVVIVYRCAPERESQLDAEFAQVIRTIDFDAR